MENPSFMINLDFTNKEPDNQLEEIESKENNTIIIDDNSYEESVFGSSPDK